MYNIILAAGNGKRFSKYKLPKPLLEVKKEPLIIRSANSLPKNNKFLFICKKQHILKYPYLKKKLINKFCDVKIITLSKTTKGQANTLLSAKKVINQNIPMIVTSTDFSFKFNNYKLKKYLDNNFEVIFVVSPNRFMRENYSQFGWVRSDKNNNVLKISCKKKIHGNSLNDKVILGSFVFTSFKNFKKGHNLMIKKKNLTKNEYYIDTLMSEIIKFKKVKIILIKKFINWGTPFEYERNKNKIF